MAVDTALSIANQVMLSISGNLCVVKRRTGDS